MSVLESVRLGDRRAALEAVAVVLAAALDEGGEELRVEALSRELRIVLKELEGLGSVGVSVGLEDALAARRKAREAADG